MRWRRYCRTSARRRNTRQINIPSSTDAYKTIEEIHKAVLKETEKDAKLAEDEWQKSAKSNGLSQFKATPAVDMRPAASGIDILVRYVTRAGDRFDMRNRLYQSVIDLLHNPATNAPALQEPEVLEPQSK